jgi:hypothetical protein
MPHAGDAGSRKAAGATGKIARRRDMESSRDRIYNQRFSQLCLTQILAKPGHALEFLVDRSTRHWIARKHGSKAASIQIGHAESLHAGGPERLFLEDADFNQLSNWKGERQGVIFSKRGVLIDGVPVEYRTAMMWESVGKLPAGTVARSPRSSGWIPG